MKMKVIKIIIVGLICIAFTCFVNSVEAAIIDVHILPEDPTMIDPITIITFGTESCGPVTIINSDFQINGYFLELIISLEVGPYTVITPWSHFEPIGTLPEGMYDLNVQTLEQSIVTDTYSMSFEVVPEPSSLVLFGFVGLIIKWKFSLSKDGFLV